MIKERHLFIVWHNGLDSIDLIINEIKNEYTILNIIDINWEVGSAHLNFARFYSYSNTNIDFKVKHCGTGLSKLIIVEDFKSTNYSFIETSRGHKKINSKQFNLKEKLRKITGGGHLIHGSNDTVEFKRDLTLLLGLKAEQYINSEYSELKKYNFTHTIDNLVGTFTWNSYEELLFVLNYSCEYLIMRNYEEILITDFQIRDIDFLVRDYYSFINIINASKIDNGCDRVQFVIKVKNSEILIDIRSVGDDYYCREWQDSALNNRVLFKKKVFVPKDEDYIFMLIYHFFIHKSFIHETYVSIVMKFFDCFDRSKILEISYNELKKYLKNQYYYFCRPKDSSVNYDEKYIRLSEIVRRVKNDYEFDELNPFGFDWKTGSDSIHLIAKKNGEKYFVKYSESSELVSREIKFLKKYCSKYTFIPELIIFRIDTDYSLLVVKFIEGKTFEELLNESNDLEKNDKEEIKSQSINIIETLNSNEIIHRDIRPSNLIYSFEKRIVFLIDWQFVLKLYEKDFSELNIVHNNIKKFRLLGSKDYVYGEWKWCDLYSMNKIIKELDNSEIIDKMSPCNYISCYYPVYNKGIIRRLYYRLYPKRKNQLIYTSLSKTDIIKINHI